MEAPPPKPKRQITDKQRENLKKGWEGLKARREAVAKAKSEGTEYVPPPKIETPPEVVIQKVMENRRTRKAPTQVSMVSKELAEVKEMLLKQLKPVEEKIVEKEVVREVPVEHVVERIVERERVLSGSALLDKLFFNK